MTSKERRALDDFWRYVNRTEEFIRQYGHTGYDPSNRDRWDDDFAAAYEAIRPALRPFSPRMFTVPTDVPVLNAYSAETAHQAVMFFLNPPQALFGSIQALDSPEYREIKNQAQEELRRVQSQKGRRKKSRMSREDLAADLTALLSALVLHHRPSEEAPSSEPLTQQELARILKWSQPRVSRRMAKLFPEDGMNGYRQSCKDGSVLKGFIKRYADGTADVEAIMGSDDEDDRD
jgi:hypothetical protein